MRYLLLLLLASSLAANELPDMPVAKPSATVDRFWTRSTKIEYAAGAGLAAWDTTITCRNLDRGGHEYWSPVSNCHQMALFTGALQLGSLTTARLLHHYHHDKLAHLPELFLIQANAHGAIYSTIHSTPQSPQLSCTKYSYGYTCH